MRRAAADLTVLHVNSVYFAMRIHLDPTLESDLYHRLVLEFENTYGDIQNSIIADVYSYEPKFRSPS